MGALHGGHLSLVHQAKKDCDFVVASIFVNPIQFGPKEDFNKYPRPIKNDKMLLASAGVDLLFYPFAKDMYFPDRSVFVDESDLSRYLCGASRSGHFRGVCTVVAKLFNIVAPDIAYFGQKDYQQAMIIKRMVRDLNFDICIKVCPTLREPDGLAMSSRNCYLNANDRMDAVVLRQALLAGKNMIDSGARDGSSIRSVMKKIVMGKKRVTIDYLDVCNAYDLTKADYLESDVVLIGALKIGVTRIIDNILVKVKK